MAEIFIKIPVKELLVNFFFKSDPWELKNTQFLKIFSSYFVPILDKCEDY